MAHGINYDTNIVQTSLETGHEIKLTFFLLQHNTKYGFVRVGVFCGQSVGYRFHCAQDLDYQKN